MEVIIARLTKAQRKERNRQKAIDAEIEEKQREQIERHALIIRKAELAGISMRQLESGKIRYRFRGERGDEVTFYPAAKSYFTFLADEGAIPKHFEAAIDQFYGAWRSALISNGAWQGKIGDKTGGENLEGNPFELYRHLVRKLSAFNLDMVQFVAFEPRDFPTAKTREYLFSLTGLIENALKALEQAMNDVST